MKQCRVLISSPMANLRDTAGESRVLAKFGATQSSHMYSGFLCFQMFSSLHMCQARPPPQPYNQPPQTGIGNRQAFMEPMLQMLVGPWPPFALPAPTPACIPCRRASPNLLATPSGHPSAKGYSTPKWFSNIPPPPRSWNAFQRTPSPPPPRTPSTPPPAPHPPPPPHPIPPKGPRA